MQSQLFIRLYEIRKKGKENSIRYDNKDRIVRSVHIYESLRCDCELVENFFKFSPLRRLSMNRAPCFAVFEQREWRIAATSNATHDRRTVLTKGGRDI